MSFHITLTSLQNGLFFILTGWSVHSFRIYIFSILISIGQDFCFLSLLGSQKINKKLVCKGN